VHLEGDERRARLELRRLDDHAVHPVRVAGPERRARDLDARAVGKSARRAGERERRDQQRGRAARAERRDPARGQGESEEEGGEARVRGAGPREQQPGPQRGSDRDRDPPAHADAECESRAAPRAWPRAGFCVEGIAPPSPAWPPASTAGAPGNQCFV